MCDYPNQTHCKGTYPRPFDVNLGCVRVDERAVINVVGSVANPTLFLVVSTEFYSDASTCNAEWQTYPGGRMIESSCRKFSLKFVSYYKFP